MFDAPRRKRAYRDHEVARGGAAGPEATTDGDPMRDKRCERRARGTHVLALIAVLLGAVGAGAAPAIAQTMPLGFGETTVISGLDTPTAVRFAPGGRVFVAEKSGLVKEFESLTDPAPRVVVDLQTQVMDYHDRGLLGLAIPPGFPTADPALYVAYSMDAPIGGTPPVYHDVCPSVLTSNCLTGARVSRVDLATGAEQVLVEDWCMQYPSHSIGSLVFGADGALYASGGEGADYNGADWGQNGRPPNPCGDPPGRAGTALTRPDSQGGALRSQDVRTTADPTGLDGTIIRIDPRTGAGWPGNPFASSPDANARRIVAYGMRNPWRMTQRPGTGELWFSEVGWGTHRGGQPPHGPGRGTRRELRLAVLRGAGLAPAVLHRPDAVRLAGGGGHDRPVLLLPPRRPGRRGRRLPEQRRLRLRALVRARYQPVPRRPTRAPCSSATTPAAASG